MCLVVKFRRDKPWPFPDLETIGTVRSNRKRTELWIVHCHGPVHLVVCELRPPHEPQSCKR